jgi:TrmH family RNA methyltransferase
MMELSRSRRLLIGRLRRRKTREREQMFLAEGVRCASEVLSAGAKVRFAVVAPRLRAQPAGTRLIERLEGARVEIIDASDADVAELADTESPQGVLLGCEQPTASLESIKSTRVLVADAIGDPGNLGALVRSAAAFGVSAVVALDGTVDPWNPKAVRASAGSIARVTMLRAGWAELDAWRTSRHLDLLVAERGGDAPQPPRRGWMLVIGSEPRGARQEIREAATRRIAIPMAGGIDSLNAAVAGSILMYALTASD